MSNFEARNDNAVDDEPREAPQSERQAERQLVQFVLALLAENSTVSASAGGDNRRTGPERFRADGSAIAGGDSSGFVITRDQSREGRTAYTIAGADGAPLVRVEARQSGRQTQTIEVFSPDAESPRLTINRRLDQRGNGTVEVRTPDGFGNDQLQTIGMENGRLAAFFGHYTLPNAAGNPVRWDIRCTVNDGIQDPSRAGAIEGIEFRVNQPGANPAPFQPIPPALRDALQSAIFEDVNRVLPGATREQLFPQVGSSAAAALASQAFLQLLSRLKDATVPISTGSDAPVDGAGPTPPEPTPAAPSVSDAERSTARGSGAPQLEAEVRELMATGSRAPSPERQQALTQAISDRLGTVDSPQLLVRLLAHGVPQALQARAQERLLQLQLSPEQRLSLIELLRSEAVKPLPSDCGQGVRMLTVAGLLAAQAQPPLSENAIATLMFSLRAGIERPQGATNFYDSNAWINLSQAFMANSRSWTARDAEFAVRHFDGQMLPSNAAEVSRMPEPAARAFLMAMRDRALRADAGPQVVSYLRMLSALPSAIVPADALAVSTLTARFRGNALNPSIGDVGQFRTLLAETHLALVSSSNRQISDVAFDSLRGSGLQAETARNSRSVEILRAYAGLAGDASRIDSVISSRYDLATTAPLHVVLERLGVPSTRSQTDAAELVRRFGGGQQGEESARAALRGFLVFGMMPAEMRSRVSRGFDASLLGRYAATAGDAPTNSPVTRFLDDLQSGRLHELDVQLFREIPERILAERAIAVADVRSVDRERIAAANARTRAMHDLTESISGEDSAQERDRLDAARRRDRLPPTLEDPTRHHPSSEALLRTQVGGTGSLARIEEANRQLFALGERRAESVRRVEAIDGLLAVTEHQRLLGNGDLAQADALAMRSFFARGAYTQEYFSAQLQGGTGLAGSSSALTRMHEAGYLASARMPSLTTPAEVEAFVRANPLFQGGAARTDSERSLAQSQWQNAFSSLMDSPSGRVLQTALGSSARLEMVGLIPSAALGRRSPELRDRLQRDAGVVNLHLRNLDEHREPLRLALRELQSRATSPEQRQAATELLHFLTNTSSHNVRLRTSLDLAKEGHLEIPTAWEEFRNEATKIVVGAAAAALIMKTGGVGVVLAPALSYAVVSGAEEALLAAGLDSTGRGSTWGAVARQRLEADEHGNFAIADPDRAMHETLVTLGMDYATSIASHFANRRGAASRMRTSTPEHIDLTSPTDAATWIAGASVASQRRNFFVQFARDFGENLGTSAATTGAAHLSDTVGLSEVGSGLLYDFMRGALTRPAPRAVRIHGNAEPVLADLNRAGLLVVEPPAQPGQAVRYFVRVGDARVPVEHIPGPVAPGVPGVTIPGPTGGAETRISVDEAASGAAPSANPAGLATSREFALAHRIEGGVPDGTTVGGTGRAVGSDGTVAGGTAAVVVNRGIDGNLRATIDQARERLRDVPDADKPRVLAEFVATQFNPHRRSDAMSQSERAQAEALYLDFLNMNSGRPMLLGDFISRGLGGAREQALLFQILAAETGMTTHAGVSMVRGNGSGGTDAINHSWNAVTINGREYVVDCFRGIYGQPAEISGLLYRPGGTMPEHARLGMLPPDTRITAGQRIDFLGSGRWRVEAVSADGQDVTLRHDASRVIRPDSTGILRVPGGGAPEIGSRVELRRIDNTFDSGWVVTGRDRDGNLLVSKPDGIRMTVSRDRLLHTVMESVGRDVPGGHSSTAAPGRTDGLPLDSRITTLGREAEAAHAAGDHATRDRILAQAQTILLERARQIAKRMGIPREAITPDMLRVEFIEGALGSCMPSEARVRIDPRRPGQLDTLAHEFRHLDQAIRRTALRRADATSFDAALLASCLGNLGNGEPLQTADPHGRTSWLRQNYSLENRQLMERAIREYLAQHPANAPGADSAASVETILQRPEFASLVSALGGMRSARLEMRVEVGHIRIVQADAVISDAALQRNPELARFISQQADRLAVQRERAGGSLANNLEFLRHTQRLSESATGMMAHSNPNYYLTSAEEMSPRRFGLSESLRELATAARHAFTDPAQVREYIQRHGASLITALREASSLQRLSDAVYEAQRTTGPQSEAAMARARAEAANLLGTLDPRSSRALPILNLCLGLNLTTRDALRPEHRALLERAERSRARASAGEHGAPARGSEGGHASVAPDAPTAAPRNPVTDANGHLSRIDSQISGKANTVVVNNLTVARWRQVREALTHELSRGTPDLERIAALNRVIETMQAPATGRERADALAQIVHSARNAPEGAEIHFDRLAAEPNVALLRRYQVELSMLMNHATVRPNERTLPAEQVKAILDVMNAGLDHPDRVLPIRGLIDAALHNESAFNYLHRFVEHSLREVPGSEPETPGFTIQRRAFQGFERAFNAGGVTGEWAFVPSSHNSPADGAGIDAVFLNTRTGELVPYDFASTERALNDKIRKGHGLWAHLIEERDFNNPALMRNHFLQGFLNRTQLRPPRLNISDFPGGVGRSSDSTGLFFPSLEPTTSTEISDLASRLLLARNRTSGEAAEALDHLHERLLASSRQRELESNLLTSQLPGLVSAFSATLGSAIYGEGARPIAGPATIHVANPRDRQDYDYLSIPVSIPLNYTFKERNGQTKPGLASVSELRVLPNGLVLAVRSDAHGGTIELGNIATLMDRTQARSELTSPAARAQADQLAGEIADRARIDFRNTTVEQLLRSRPELAILVRGTTDSRVSVAATTSLARDHAAVALDAALQAGSPELRRALEPLMSDAMRRASLIEEVVQARREVDSNLAIDQIMRLRELRSSDTSLSWSQASRIGSLAADPVLASEPNLANRLVLARRMLDMIGPNALSAEQALAYARILGSDSHLWREYRDIMAARDDRRLRVPADFNAVEFARELQSARQSLGGIGVKTVFDLAAVRRSAGVEMTWQQSQAVKRILDNWVAPPAITAREALGMQQIMTNWNGADKPDVAEAFRIHRVQQAFRSLSPEDARTAARQIGGSNEAFAGSIGTLSTLAARFTPALAIGDAQKVQHILSAFPGLADARALAISQRLTCTPAQMQECMTKISAMTGLTSQQRSAVLALLPDLAREAVVWAPGVQFSPARLADAAEYMVRQGSTDVLVGIDHLLPRR